VLFAHGLLWSTWLWHPQIEALRGRSRCVAFDFRGQGRSEVTASGYDMETLAADAAALIEQLGVAPVHFVGISMGGFVGLRLAARRPGLIRSLALLNTAADGEVPSNLPRYKLRALAARLAGFRAVARPVMKIDVTGELRALEGVTSRAPVPEEELRRIAAPTLVVIGTEDQAISAARSKAIAERIPGARLVVVPRAGHSSSLEAPEDVTAALREFWGSLGRARPVTPASSRTSP
jgi:3-oxoadipate enol-lactonase